MRSPHRLMHKAGAMLALMVLSALRPPSAAAAEPQPFDDQIRPILERHCLECHGAEKPKKNFRVDQLTADLAEESVRKRWLAVQKRVAAGEMPPKSKPRPSEAEVTALGAWIQSGLAAAEKAEREASQGRVVLRRLNRVEYENTIRDLLGIDIELKELLPIDSSAAGFDNVGDALHVSSFLMERYLDAADRALAVAIANRPQPPLLQKRLSMKDERHVKVTTEKVFRQLDNGLVMFSSSAWQGITVTQFYPQDRGKYRFRISAYGMQTDKPVTYRVDAGPMLMGTKNHLVSYFDVSPEKPTVAEFVDNFEARDHIRILPYGLAAAQTVNKVGADNYDGPGLVIEWIDVEGPLHDTWPPESHRRIFGEMPQQPAPIYNQRDRVEVVAEDPLADAGRILRSFAGRAFRRTVTDDDVKPIVALFEQRLADGYSFEQAVRVGLKAILVSPEFLYLRETPGKLDDFALASRLSYFLWSTMPDDELLSLAAAGKLSDAQTLRQQVERLLASPKAAAFTENFVGQWLGLRDIDFTEPSHLLYPEFDDMLKVAMVRETELFFAEVLKNDLSLANFVSSDFSMLNGRLAKHYGIPGVDGWEFRKVALPQESHRGGVLTMAGVLKVTANGTTTSPVMRGAWVLNRILGTPPPPPPADVPAIDPDIRGATTIREQLAKHRQLESCASCHVEIDPPGFALESFDVIGGWRDHYRTTGSGKSVVVDGRRMSYHEGKPVDPSDVLPSGERFANVDEFKTLLLRDKDQLARALTEKLLTYATGAAPRAADHGEVEAIVGKIREKDYGLRSLVHEVVQSSIFQKK